MAMLGPADGGLRPGQANASSNRHCNTDPMADRHVNSQAQSDADTDSVAHADSHPRTRAIDDGRLLRAAFMVTRFAPGVVHRQAICQ